MLNYIYKHNLINITYYKYIILLIKITLKIKGCLNLLLKGEKNIFSTSVDKKKYKLIRNFEEI